MGNFGEFRFECRCCAMPLYGHNSVSGFRFFLQKNIPFQFSDLINCPCIVARKGVGLLNNSATTTLACQVNFELTEILYALGPS
jgi:hypothetical protein